MSLSKEQTQLIAAGAAIAVIGYGIWSWVQNKGESEGQENDKKLTVIEEAHKLFVDAQAEGVKTLYKKEAFKRSSEVTDVSYKLAYALNRGGDTFEG